MPHRRLFRARLAVLGVLALAALTAGCGGAPPAHPTVSDLTAPQLFYESAYLGHQVGVRGKVADVRGPRAFDLVGDQPGDLLPVVTDQPVTVHPDELVAVSGTVGQLHTSVPEDKAPYRQDALYDAYTTKAYLYHASLTPSG